jgi:Permeases
MLEHLFKLKEHNARPGTEIMAGMATFLTAVYILVVNPLIQSHAGMPHKALFTATALAIIIGTLLIGLFANMPFILAPGMGINVFFAFSIVGGKGYAWQEALTAVLVAGVLFVLTGLLGLRTILYHGFPEPLKYAMTVSLGLMIAVIGLKNSGVIVMLDDRVALGTVTSGSPLIALLGILVTGMFLSMGLRAAVLLGIIATTMLGALNGVTDYSRLLAEGVFSMPPDVTPIAMAFSWDFSRIFTSDFVIIVFTLLAIDIFDSLGTFVGVLNHFTGDEKKKYEERIPRALMCDAVATVAGACVGASTVTTFVESSTGITAGGKTGMVSLTISALVFLALFISPVFLMVPAAATTPALVIVGMYMMKQSHNINFSDVSEGLPAIVMVLVTALTLSISDGLMFGWISFVVFKLISGKERELNVTTLAVAAFFVVRLMLL